MIDYQKEGLCKCKCHKNEGILHAMACCKLTYRIYLNDENEIQNIPWIEAKKEYNEWVDKQIGDDSVRQMNKKGLVSTKFPYPEETIEHCMNRLGC